MTHREPGQLRELILASAGSGKTFRISSRIIGLLASGEPPATILASTFTRKAAGEILDRVLVRLATAASDADAARELARHVWDRIGSGTPGDGARAGGPVQPSLFPTSDGEGSGTPGGTDDPGLAGDADPTGLSAGVGTPGFWQSVLVRTVRELHRLDVGTLDSFFVRSVRGFGHDLGLPSGWGIADDPAMDRIRSEALEEVLLRLDGRGMVELVRTLHSGDVKRAVHRALADDVDGILRTHLELDPAGPGWSAMEALSGAPAEEAQSRLRIAADRVRGAPVPAKADGAPDRRWEAPRDDAAAALAAGDVDGFLDNGLVKKLVYEDPGEDATYYGHPFPDELRDSLQAGIAATRDALARDLASRAGAMERLARSYEEAYLDRLLHSGLLRFEDVTRLLTAAPGDDGPAPTGRADLFYRLDSGTRHVLLDEFQDTSLLQWRALAPLMDRVTGLDTGAPRGAAVVVADPKQSIYGWRGAAPIVVDALSDRYALPREEMATSWRSSPVVLEAVNRVFQGVQGAPVLQEKPADAKVAEEWGRAFRPHEPARRERPLAGRVRLLAGPALEGARQDQPRLHRWVADHVAELHRSAPGFTIGVLTRTNAAVARIIFELGQRHIPASEEGGTALTDSAPVVSILALLRLADHPGDGLARYHVARTPVGAAVGYTREDHVPAAVALSHRVRSHLVAEGYGPFLAQLAARLRPACDRREWQRLRHLVELGYRWDAAAPVPGLRVRDFVRLVEATRAESPAEDPVRVMTVHGSKGLEFDVVVVPELFGSSFSHRSESSPLTYRPGGTGPVTHAYPPLKKAYLALFRDVPEIREADAQARAASTRDALGTLYVAMTRPRYALDLVVPADGEKGMSTARSHARLLREKLAPETVLGTAAEGDVLLDSGDPGWMHHVPGHAGPTAGEAVEEPPVIRLRPATGRVRNLERRTPSGAEGGDSVRLDEILGLSGGLEARRRGTLVHAWLETLEWAEDGLAPEEVLLRAARRVAPQLAPDRVAETLAWLRTRLSVDAVRSVLSRSSWPDGAVVERELPFLVREGDALVEGVVDRLVLVRDGERVVEATVLDFKTDVLHAGDLGAVDERVAFYAPQILAYRKAVAHLYELDETRVEGSLVFLDAGLVRKVPGEAPEARGGKRSEE